MDTAGSHLLDPNLYPQSQTDLDANFDQNNFAAYGLNHLANASVNHNGLYNQSASHPQLHLQRTRYQTRSDGSPTTQSPYAQSQHSAPSQSHDDPYGIPSRLQFSPSTSLQNGSPQQPLYMPIQRLQQEQQSTPMRPGVSPTTASPPQATTLNEDGTKSHFAGMQVVKDPPHLGEWRDRLFNIQGTVTMTEQEFQIYFPHIDNVYSHRSTQKYKRRPFVSHYWDCRLKGRPSGTPKSDDPNKKKRKRTARERDLCDVKIKITEYFPASADWQGTPNGSTNTADGSALTFISETQPQHHDSLSDSAQPFGVLAPNPTLPPGHPGANGARYYTVQMVNGNTAGSETVSPTDPGPASTHKHSLEDSDKIKKNSVQRHFLKGEKEAKRLSSTTTTISGSISSPPKKRKPGTASGSASITKDLHSRIPSALSGGPLVLFANSYCPFAQRIWIALEIKRLPYQYVEVIPAHMQGGTVERPPALLEICPEGIVPCLKHGKWGIWESGVCLEYLEDLTVEAAGLNGLEAHAAENWLLPPGDARLKAWSRLWVDHVGILLHLFLKPLTEFQINRKILPAFYHLLLAPPVSANDPTSTSLLAHRTVLTDTLTSTITALVNASHASGPFFLGPSISFVDVMFAPWVLRLSRVLTRFRGYEFSSALDQRWQAWVAAIESDERVRATTSEPASYADVYSDVGECGMEALRRLEGDGMLRGERKLMAELTYAKTLLGQDGFGMGGDVWGREVDVDSNAFRHSGAVGLQDDPHMLGR
jgi:glutathione S-transferase